MGDTQVKGDAVSTDNFPITSNNVISEPGFVRFWFTSQPSSQELAGLMELIVADSMWAKCRQSIRASRHISC